MNSLAGDVPCAECGTRRNPVWFTDSVFWNAVVRREGNDDYGFCMRRWGGDPILCLLCFAAIAELRGFHPTGWRVLPDWPWRQGS